jgi:hypothetical protein
MTRLILYTELYKTRVEGHILLYNFEKFLNFLILAKKIKLVPVFRTGIETKVSVYV